MIRRCMAYNCRRAAWPRKHYCRKHLKEQADGWRRAFAAAAAEQDHLLRCTSVCPPGETCGTFPTDTLTYEPTRHGDVAHAFTTRTW